MTVTRLRHSILPLASIAAFLWLGTGCPTVPPPRAQSDVPKEKDDEPNQTAEWLFVTAEGQPTRDKKGECEKVGSWIEGEKGCTGDLCVHARDLGQDWLQRCSKVVPDQVDAVQELVDKASERAKLADDDCVREGRGLLGNPTCDEPVACAEQAQKWVSRCGERYATPLIVLMVTRTLERRFKEDTRIEIDTRSCDAMAKQIGEAYGCESEDKCKAAAETAAAWQLRCMDGEAGVPIVLAFQIADVLVGGGKSVDPIPVDPSIKSIPDGTFPLLMDDNRGAVAWICGTRTKDLSGYLGARKGCVPGEVIVAHLDKTNRLRTVSVPHANDADFTRLFPFLRLKGEQDARDMAALADFQKELEAAATEAQARHGDRAYKKLAAAMLPRVWAIARQASYQKALASFDSRLEPAFKAWGKAKAQAADKIRKDDEFAMFVSRALASPLADMRDDGSVSAGASATPVAFALGRWLPTSMQTYRGELDRAEKKATKKRPGESRVLQLKGSLTSEMTACAAAQKEVSDAEEASATCLFSGAACPEQKSAELSSAADAARQKAQAARMRVDAILSSGILTQDEADRAEADRVAKGCLDP